MNILKRTSDHITTVMGRFNPPHAGHFHAFDQAAAYAKKHDTDFIICTFYREYQMHDPLGYAHKIDLLRKIRPEYWHNIWNEGPSNPFDHFVRLNKMGYKEITIFAGPERFYGYDRFREYNGYKPETGEYPNYDKIHIKSSGDRVAPFGMSGTKLREAVKANKYKYFVNNTTGTDDIKQHMWLTLRKFYFYHGKTE